MIHRVIYKDAKAYCSFPLLDYKSDDEIYIGFFKAPVVDHFGIYDWIVMKSVDKGLTWEENDSMATSLNIGGRSPREISDRCRFESGTKLLSVGSFGFKNYMDGIISSRHISLIAMDKPELTESSNKSQSAIGASEIYPAGLRNIVTFNRPLVSSGWAITPAYGVSKSTNLDKSFIIRVNIEEVFWELIPLFPSYIESNEMALIEASPKLLLALVRNDHEPYLFESWSKDAGETWSYPTLSDICGGPPHLLKLKDGRILCTYGVRTGKMGVEASVMGEYRRWEEPYVLRDDSGFPSSLHKKGFFGREIVKTGESDVGYPISIQLKDGSILTVYYITLKDKVAHIASTKWHL